MPKFLSELVRGMEMPNIDWRDAIRDRIQGYDISDYTWIKRHKNSRATGVYLPDNLKESISCRVYFDTSGSVSNKELNQYLSEVKDIFKQFRNAYVELITFDTEINNKIILEEDVTEIDCKGRGGTDFQAVFKDEDIENNDLVVIFSDGECSYPDNRDNYQGEVIWAITKGNKIEHLEGQNDKDVVIEVSVNG
jgi:predicted metal-dependent peptidase